MQLDWYTGLLDDGSGSFFKKTLRRLSVKI